MHTQTRENKAGLVIATTAQQKFAFHGATPVAQRSGAAQAAAAAMTAAALTGTLTGTLDNALADVPAPTDSPASVDALRDDIVATLLPIINKNFKELQDEANKLRADLVARDTLIAELRAALVEKGVIKGSA